MLDVSFYDGRHEYPLGSGKWAYMPIDWNQALSKWPAAIIRQGQGLSKDPLYQLQIQAARGRVVFGTYHVFNPQVNAIKAALSCVDDISSSGGFGQLGVWLDCETIPGVTIPEGHIYFSALASWMNEMKTRMIAAGVGDRRLGIYTRKSFWDPLYAQAGYPMYTQSYPAWVAQYRYENLSPTEYSIAYHRIVTDKVYPLTPSLPNGLKTLVAFQWTARGFPGDVPGYPPYKKSVDFNLLYDNITSPMTPPTALTDKQKLDKLWDAHPELH